eukprot:853525_1
MSNMLSLLLCLSTIPTLSEATGWSPSSSTLPFADNSMAVGAYNDTIFLLGGANNQNQMTEYHISTDTFTNKGPILEESMYAYGQIWSQIDETMYIIDTTGEHLSTFDMAHKQYTKQWHNLETSVNGYMACLAASNDHLFITGGTKCLTKFQVLNLGTLGWVSNTPPMQQCRRSHACAVSIDYLWVFAGWDANANKRLRTNERIHIDNIASNDWAFTESFPTGIDPYVHRAIAWQDKIHIIGGCRGFSNDAYLDTVYTVDATTGQMVLSPDRLNYDIAWAGTVVHHNEMFVFGGRNYWDNNKNTWMKYQFATSQPTADPTSSPSSNPSTHPTARHTLDPSNDPTLRPTSDPSIPPTTSKWIPSTSKVLTMETTVNERLTTLTDVVSLSTTSSVQNSTQQPAFTLSTTLIVIIVLLVSCIGLCIVCICGMFCWQCQYGKKHPSLNKQRTNSIKNVPSGHIHVKGVSPKPNVQTKGIEQGENHGPNVNHKLERVASLTQGMAEDQDEDDVVLNDDEFIVRSDSNAENMFSSTDRRGTNHLDEGNMLGTIQ